MNKFVHMWGSILVFVGIIAMCAGLIGFTYTYKNVVRESITTPEDASIPNVPVRGPLTMKAQADIIHEHALKSANGLTFAQMPRQVPKLDNNGNPVLDANGDPIMVANDRSTWITATTLIAALNVGILAYAFSALVFVLGLMIFLNGFVFKKISEGRM